MAEAIKLSEFFKVTKIHNVNLPEGVLWTPGPILCLLPYHAKERDKEGGLMKIC